MTQDFKIDTIKDMSDNSPEWKHHLVAYVSNGEYRFRVDWRAVNRIPDEPMDETTIIEDVTVFRLRNGRLVVIDDFRSSWNSNKDWSERTTEEFREHMKEVINPDNNMRDYEYMIEMAKGER